MIKETETVPHGVCNLASSAHALSIYENGDVINRRCKA